MSEAEDSEDDDYYPDDDDGYCDECGGEGWILTFNGGPRFAVIKEDKSQSYSDEERRFGARLYQVFVCGDCAEWYPDPVEVC